MMVRRFLAFFLAFVLILTLVACAGSGNTTTANTTKASTAATTVKPAANQKVFKMGYTDPDTRNSHYAYYIRQLNIHLDQLSGGTIKFQGYGSGQLGTEVDVINGCKDGSIDSGLISVDAYSSQIPVMQLFSLPYMFQYNGQFALLTDNDEFMKPIYDILRDKWSIECIGYPVHCGFRNVLANKEIKSIDDVKDLTIRITTSPLLQRNWKALGAIPTIVAFAETYTAFQQGVVKAIEVPIEAHYFMKFYEAGKSIAMINMDDLVGWPMISKKLWDTLSKEEQGWIKEAAALAVKEQREFLWNTSEKECLDDMAKQKGITVTTPDLAPFKAATRVVHEEYRGIIGAEMLDKAYAILDEDNAKKGLPLWKK